MWQGNIICCALAVGLSGCGSADEASDTPALTAATLGERTVLPGNRMSFIGVSSGDDRRDLIAYLLDATDTDTRSHQKDDDDRRRS